MSFSGRYGVVQRWINRHLSIKSRDRLHHFVRLFVLAKLRPGNTHVSRIEESLWADLKAVGPKKPVSYLPLSQIELRLRRTPEEIERDVCSLGLASIRFGHGDCLIMSGALYVFDPTALAAVLSRWSKTLTKYELPYDSWEFVSIIARVNYAPDNAISWVVAEAFGETDLHRLAHSEFVHEPD